MNIHDKEQVIKALTDALEELDRLQKEVEDWKKAASNFGCDCPIDLLIKHYWGCQDKQFTSIYVDTWMPGCHQQSIARMKRIELQDGETVLDCLKREGISESTVFLFAGHPKLQGEQ